MEKRIILKNIHHTKRFFPNFEILNSSMLALLKGKSFEMLSLKCHTYSFNLSTMQHSIQKNIDEIIARFSQENKADFVGFQERFSREIERILDEIKAKSPPLTNEEYQKIFTFPLQQRQNLMQQVVGEERKERLVQALDSVEDPVTKEILLERIYEQIEHFGKIQKLSSNLYLART